MLGPEGSRPQSEYIRAMAFIGASAQDIEIPHRYYNEDDAIYVRADSVAKILYGSLRDDGGGPVSNSGMR